MNLANIYFQVVPPLVSLGVAMIGVVVFIGDRKSKITLAKTAVLKAGRYAYRDRRAKKRDKRALWIVRLNAALREQGTHYASFIHQLKTANVILDRKVLADLAQNYGPVFHEILKNLK